ncbi:hypothetical protein B0T17DRAFT_510600 [Bombardia bombarda]|uniref:Uncharacterized protein n=1 Tax=Bombardia bombarda TaxID=252184 RepID=A0AA40BWD6_9PEZI|nr:hypothetical protein B0T17DRAFT_510600 [Bombardia bombarda]
MRATENRKRQQIMLRGPPVKISRLITSVLRDRLSASHSEPMPAQLSRDLLADLPDKLKQCTAMHATDSALNDISYCTVLSKSSRTAQHSITRWQTSDNGAVRRRQGYADNGEANGRKVLLKSRAIMRKNAHIMQFKRQLKVNKWISRLAAEE